MKLTDTIKTIELGKIILTKRLRPVDADAVNALAESIAQVGMMQPIVVAKSDDTDEYTLIAGRHRYAAARKLKHETIKCVVRTVASKDEALVLEIDENMRRKALSPAEEAQQLKLRTEVWNRIAEASGVKLTGKGKKSAGMSVREVAKKTGKGKDTIARGIKRGKELANELDDVAGTSLDKGDELDALVKVKKKNKAKAAELVAEAKSGKKVSAKKTLKKVEEEVAETAGPKAKAKLDAKRLEATLKDFAAMFQRHKDTMDGTRGIAKLRNAFIEYCDANDA
jgi:ParB family chromosome partitioning protein